MLYQNMMNGGRYVGGAFEEFGLEIDHFYARWWLHGDSLHDSEWKYPILRFAIQHINIIQQEKRKAIVLITQTPRKKE